MLIRSSYTSNPTNLPCYASKKIVSTNNPEKTFQRIQENQLTTDIKYTQIPNGIGKKDKMIISNIMKQNNVKPIIVKNNDATKDKNYSIDNFNLDFLCNFVIKRCVDPHTTKDEEIKLINDLTNDILSCMIGKPVTNCRVSSKFLSSDEIDLKGQISTGILQMIGVSRRALKNVTQKYSSQWNNYIATGKTSINFEELLKNELLKNEAYHFTNVLRLSFKDMFKMMDSIKKIRDDFKVNTDSEKLLSVSLGHAQLKSQSILKDMEKSPIMKDLFTQGIKNNIEKKTNEFLTNKERLLREENISDEQIKKELATIHDNIKSNIERFTKILKEHDNTLTTKALKEIKALEKAILSTSKDS